MPNKLRELKDKFVTLLIPTGVEAVQVEAEEIKSFLISRHKAFLQSEIERLEEEKMNLELLNGAKMNGLFRKLNMKESIGWNKCIQHQINHYKQEIANIEKGV